MALDIDDGYKKIKKEVTTKQKYNQVKKDIKQLEKNTGDSFEDWSGGLESKFGKFANKQLSSAEKTQQKFKKDFKTQFDQMLEIKFLTQKSGDKKATKYLKKTFVTAIEQIKPKIFDIVSELGVKAVGCESEQEFPANTTVYIKVGAIDFVGLLKEDPTGTVGKISYENLPITYGSTTSFSMNKELYQRIQNINVPYSSPTFAGTDYKGPSTQNLFDITYVENYTDPITGNLVVGNFFKVDLKPRSNNTNKVSEFFKDYYSSIDIIDYKYLFTNLINQLTGAISIEKKDGDKKLIDFTKFLMIMKRVFGMCFDETKEIDVSGVAKISQTDVVDDAFFEFTEVDLRYIDSVISDIKLGVVEFEDCGTVKLPVDVNAVLDTLDSLIFNPGTNNNNEIENAAENITKPFERKGLNLDLSFLKEYPRALLMTILSPKTILPIMVMSKSLGQDTVDSVNSLMDFAKQFKTYIVQLASKVMALFVKILFDIIKADIIALTQSILADIKNESVVKKSLLVLSLVALITKLVTDFRQCKSVIDDLLSVLSLVEKSMKAQKKPLPYPLLVASRVLSGFSKTRAMLKVIEKFDELGLPTGPMPDGSPNLFLAAADAIIGAIDEEETQNGQVQIAVDPLSVLPIGVTIPQVVYGKKL
jgi:hypothetical protein